jgi:NADH-quinone oxidoreductase subunit N
MVAVVAAITMIIANLIAIQQHNIKRLLAYSSISQVGYMLIAIAVMSQASASALLLHMAGYVFTNLAAFACLIAFYNRTEREEIRDFAGLAERSPFLALMLTICLFSLAGMPLFAGFTSKFFLFQAGADGDLLWLTGIGVVTSFISLYYYLVVIKQMYIGVPAEGSDTSRVSVGPLLWSTIALLVVGVFFVGIYPTPFFRAADHASQILFPL